MLPSKPAVITHILNKSTKGPIFTVLVSKVVLKGMTRLSCLKSDKDFQVYGGLLLSIDKRLFLFCLHGWFYTLFFLF